MPNEALITIASRHSAHYERLKSHESAKYDEFLKEIDRNIRLQLSSVNLTDLTRARLEAKVKAISALLNGSLEEYHKVWRASIKDAASYEAGFEIRSLEQVVDGVSFVLPSDAQISSAVFSAPMAGIQGPAGGSLLEPFYRDFSNATKRKVENAIRAGYAQGQTTQQVVQKIRGTSASGFSDGILATTKKDATAMAHTSLQHAAMQARGEVWKANDDVIKRVRWVSTLDSKTSTLCRSLDGQEYALDKGPRPPAHVNCRSTTTAVLADEYAFLSKGRTRSARTPKGKVTTVKASQSYYDWLKGQPRKFQESILGRDRTKLFREGGLSAERFAELNLNKNFAPATLDQMRAMEPTAFERAGL